MTIDTNAAGLQVNSILTPQFPVCLTAVATTANVTYTDAPTNTVEMLPLNAAPVLPTKGMRFTSVKMLLRASAAAAIEGQLYVSDSAGTIKRFINSTLIPITTLTANTAQTEVDMGYSEANPLTLMAGERLWFAISVANTGVVCRAEGGAYGQ